MKFFFTYGDDGQYPFNGGWTEVEAPDRETACAVFRYCHPPRDPVCPPLNCAEVYTEEQFKKSMMWPQVNYKDRCHERITVEVKRETLDKKKKEG